MTDGSQTQRAGSHSQQLQVFGTVNMVGVSEERAREISRDNFREMFAQYSAESLGVASERVEKLDERYIKQLAKDGLLQALADPAFQVTLRKAQLGAASTEREDDYVLLANLLLDRAKHPTDRPVKASINRAVEIIDQLDWEALTGLTVVRTVLKVRPLRGSLDQVLHTMEKMLEQIIQGRMLPQGIEWLEHLEILDAIRIDHLQQFVNVEHLWPGAFAPWLSTGVVADSPEDIRARTKLCELGSFIPVISHPLKPGYNTLPGDITEHLSAMEGAGWDRGKVAQIETIARGTYGLGTKDEGVITAFMERARERPNMNAVIDWWGTIEKYFTMTSVGAIVAKANTNNLDKLNILT